MFCLKIFWTKLVLYYKKLDKKRDIFKNVQRLNCVFSFSKTVKIITPVCCSNSGTDLDPQFVQTRHFDEIPTRARQIRLFRLFPIAEKDRLWGVPAFDTKNTVRVLRLPRQKHSQWPVVGFLYTTTVGCQLAASSHL